jgi:hypothetical protein
MPHAALLAAGGTAREQAAVDGVDDSDAINTGCE